jgi:hypothetical protein
MFLDLADARDLGKFIPGFLDAVLPDILYPGVKALRYQIHGNGFRDGNQRH